MQTLEEENAALREECQKLLQGAQQKDEAAGLASAPMSALAELRAELEQAKSELTEAQLREAAAQAAAAEAERRAAANAAAKQGDVPWQSSAMEQRSKDLFDRANQQEGELAQAADRIRMLEARLAAAEAARASPSPAALDDAHKQLGLLEAQVQKLAIENHRLKARADALEELDKEAAGLEAELVTAQGKLRRLQKTLELQQAELDKDGPATSEQILLRRQNAALQQQIRDLEDNDARLNAQVADLKRQLRGLQRDAGTFDAQGEMQTQESDQRAARMQDRLMSADGSNGGGGNGGGPQSSQQAARLLNELEDALSEAQKSSVRAAQEKNALNQQMLDATERAGRAEAQARTQSRQIEALQARLAAATTANEGVMNDDGILEANDPLAEARRERDEAEAQARQAQVAAGGLAARSELLERQNADLPRLQAQLLAAQARIALLEDAARFGPKPPQSADQLPAAATAANVAALQQMVLEQQRQARLNADEAAALRAELERLNQELMATKKASAETLGERAAEIESLKDALHRLRARLLESQQDLPMPAQQSELDRDELERKLLEAEARLRQSNTESNRGSEQRRRQSVQVGLKDAELQAANDQIARLKRQLEAASPDEQQTVLRTQLADAIARADRLQSRNAELEAENNVWMMGEGGKKKRGEATFFKKIFFHFFN